MDEIKNAKRELKGKNITFNEPIVLVGELSSCNVCIKSTIKPEIILSQFELEAALKIMGNHHIVNANLFTTKETKVKK